MAINTFATLKTAIQNFSKRDDLAAARLNEFVALAEDRIATDVRVRAMETQSRLIWKKDETIAASALGGDADDITIDSANDPTSNAFGDSYIFTAEGTNTGAMTVDVESIGAVAIKKIYEGTTEALAAGDVRQGADYRIYYDGTQFLIAPEHAALLPSDFLEVRSLWLNASAKKLEYLDPNQFWDRVAQNQTARPRMFTIEGDWAVAAPAPDSTYFGHLDYFRRFTAFSADGDTNVVLTRHPGLYLYGSLIELADYIKDDASQLKWAMKYEETVARLNHEYMRSRIPTGATTRSDVSVL